MSQSGKEKVFAFLILQWSGIGSDALFLSSSVLVDSSLSPAESCIQSEEHATNSNTKYEPSKFRWMPCKPGLSKQVSNPWIKLSRKEGKWVGWLVGYLYVIRMLVVLVENWST